MVSEYLMSRKQAAKKREAWRRGGGIRVYCLAKTGGMELWWSGSWFQEKGACFLKPAFPGTPLVPLSYEGVVVRQANVS